MLEQNLKQGLNQVHILGRLNDIDLRERDSAKDNRHYINGKVNFLVEQSVGGQMEQEIIPVSILAFEKTNKGTPNPAYQNAYDLMTKGTSVAALGDPTKADVYELSSGRLIENNFLSRVDGSVVSYPVINGSFFNKRKPGEMEEEATFEVEVVIANMIDEEVNDVPTGRLLIDGLIVQYNGLPDKIHFVVENKEAINYISQNWEVEDTVKLNGKIRYGAEIKEIQSDDVVGFGEAPVRVRARTIREFVVTGGTPPYDEDRKYNCDDVATALAEKKTVTEARLKQSKESSSTFNAPGKSRLSRGF